MAGNENIWFGLSRILEKKILDGEYTGRLPGIRKFSTALGVHPVTLIKALRHLEEKKLVVIEDRKGTFIVTSPDRRKYKTVMFVNNGAVVSQMPRVLDILEKHHYKHLSLFFEEEQFKNNPGMILNFPADGFVFTLSSLCVPTVMHLTQEMIPFVSTDNWSEPCRINSVGVDNRHAICTLLEKLKSRGHRKVAFFNSPRAEEYQFFLDQIRESFERVFGTDFSPEMFMTDISSSNRNFKKEDFKEQAAREYLRRCAAMPEPPTAFLLVDDWCRTVRRILEETGFDIPAEISIAGSFRYVPPDDFSAALFDHEEICCAALEQLFKQLENPKTEKVSKLISPHFPEGKTIGPATPPDLKKWQKLRG